MPSIKVLTVMYWTEKECRRSHYGHLEKRGQESGAIFSAGCSLEPPLKLIANDELIYNYILDHHDWFSAHLFVFGASSLWCPITGIQFEFFCNWITTCKPFAHQLHVL